MVDSAALGEFAEQVTGRDGVLASAARMVLGPARVWTTPVTAPETATDAELVDLVSAELGSDWPRLVAPAFDARKAVVLDDRWASAREDLVEAVAGRRRRDRRRLAARLSERFEGAGHVVADAGELVAGQGAGSRSQRARDAVRPDRRGRGEPRQGRYTRRGRGGHRRVQGIDRRVGGRANCSRAAPPSSRRRRGSTTTDWRSTRQLYRDNARFGATLWVVPANMASYSDIDKLVEWVGSEQTESLGPQGDPPQGCA